LNELMFVINLYSMTTAEHLASLTLALTPGAVVTETDVPGAPPSTCDLRVDFEGTSWAVEVTQAMDPVDAAAWGAARRRNWQVPGLTRCWALVVENGFNSKAIQTAAAEALPRLEALGANHISIPHRIRDADHAEPLLRLWQAGVQHGTSYAAPEDEVPWIDLGTTRSGHEPPSSMACTVQAEIDKADNRTKLASADADERHLFIWLENGTDYPAMHDRSTDEVSIVLPDEIDVVWVGRTLQGDWPITHLWRFTNGDGWHVRYHYGKPPNADRIA